MFSSGIIVATLDLFSHNHGMETPESEIALIAVGQRSLRGGGR